MTPSRTVASSVPVDSVHVVRQAIAAYEAGGIEALAPFYHPDAVIVGGPFFGPQGTHHGGVDGIRSLNDGIARDGQELKATPMDVRPGASPELVLVEGVVAANYTGGGPAGAWRSWWVVRVRDGKIARLEIFHEESLAVAAAGLER